MLHPEYPIRTERLLLRPLDPAADVDACLEYQSDEEVCRYIPYTPSNREQVIERLERAVSVIDEPGQVFNLAVVLADTGELIGDVVLFFHSAEHRSGEVGYVINPRFQGNGYATEVTRALLTLAFDGLDLHRVVGRIDARNAASAAVLRRVGMRQEAHLRENEWFKGEWGDEVVFAILADEWRAG
ncbi:MAG TPA: GNAT family protein [Jatrophihabitans sp.]|jgi:RimJ/RimL family protein N-acetyltransferase|uniref:GNAT family N-acetyltransferase n=1 Tax=Jatrophihabitans sp. TaxID=1932789 RepID=UPI002E051561|nr:GNAT family protein [Jatrophihabitans sp.]